MNKTACTTAFCLTSLWPLSAHATERPELSFVLGYESEYERNLDLDRHDDEDYWGNELTLRATIRHRIADDVLIHAEAEAGYIREHTQGERRQSTRSLKINQAYLRFDDFVGRDSRLYVGRFLQRDYREWLVDENFDGARWLYEPEGVAVDLTVARANLAHRDLLDSASNGDTVDNFIASASFETRPDLWQGAYAVFRNDRTDANKVGRPLHMGLRSHGELTDGLDHWFDIGIVRGSDGKQPLHGTGLTGGMTYTFDAAMTPRFSAGYAWASGDGDENDGRDRAFRQTGLQANEGRFGNGSKLRYYGEAFDPELSNMAIITVAFGINPTDDLMVDLVYNHYRQNDPSTDIRDSALDMDPTGKSGDLGQELDLVVTWEPDDAWEIQAAVGYFKPGKAFEDADDALYARLEVDWKF